MNRANQDGMKTLRAAGRVLWQVVKFTLKALLAVAQLLAVLVGLMFDDSRRAQDEARRDLLR